jgi:hypothetical protein
LGLLCAEGKFDNNPTTVLSKNGATIDDILVVQDEDHLYIVNDQQVNSAPQGFNPTPVKTSLLSCPSVFLILWQLLSLSFTVLTLYGWICKTWQVN